MSRSLLLVFSFILVSSTVFASDLTCREDNRRLTKELNTLTNEFVDTLRILHPELSLTAEAISKARKPITKLEVKPTSLDEAIQQLEAENAYLHKQLQDTTENLSWYILFQKSRDTSK